MGEARHATSHELNEHGDRRPAVSIMAFADADEERAWNEAAACIMAEQAVRHEDGENGSDG